MKAQHWIFACWSGVAAAGCGDAPPDTSASSATALSKCVDLTAVADARISPLEPHKNFGKKPTLRVGEHVESLVAFDLDPVPAAATIDSAALGLYVSDADGKKPLHVHRATGTWTEADVTFASFTQRFDAAVVGTLQAKHDNVRKWVDLTPLARAWQMGAVPNQGILLESKAHDEITLVSREGGVAWQRPTLRVCYSLPADHCAPSLCQNGGHCVDTATGYVCQCPPGFFGATCAQFDCSGAPDGTPCDDGNACTQGETCSGGVCAPASTTKCGCTPGVDCATADYAYALSPDDEYYPLYGDTAHDANAGPTAFASGFLNDANVNTAVAVARPFDLVFRFSAIRSFESLSLDGDFVGLTAVTLSTSSDGTTFSDTRVFSQAQGNLPGAAAGKLSLDLGGLVGRYVKLSFAQPVALFELSFADPCSAQGSCNPASGICSFVPREDGIICGAGGTCRSGACTNCELHGKTDCGGTCADLSSDASHCGACGSGCQSGDSCHGGACSGCGALGRTDCGDGLCRELSSNSFACGTCGTTCPSGDPCIGGACAHFPYPAGPYGTAVGDTISNLSFEGLTDDEANGLVHDNPLVSLALGKYQRVEGVRNTKVLLLTLSTQWCGPCNLEEPTLVAWSKDYEAWAPGRVKMLTFLAENATYHPATALTLVQWGKKFSVPFDLGLDPSGTKLLSYASNPSEYAFPFHILVRTDGMKIAAKFVGAELASLQQAIDAILAEGPDSFTRPCKATSMSCGADADCCAGLVCNAGICGEPCRQVGQACSKSATCCAGLSCKGGLCAEPAPDSCEGRCDAQAPSGCMCDAECASYGDCCTDKLDYCP